MERNYQIIAVDFDGTLCFSKWTNVANPIRHLSITSKNGNPMAIN